MEWQDWLRHPLRCLYCVWDGRVHADCRGRFEITPEGRQALAAMRVRNVTYLADGEVG